MDQVLGLVFLALYIVGVVGLAAAMTWITVKIFPTKSNGGQSPDERKTQAAANDGSTGGRLFRKAKRGEA